MHASARQPPLGQPGDDLSLRLPARHAVEGARVEEHPILRHAGQGLPFDAHHLADGQPESGGELEVAAIVRRHGHDRPGAVLHEHVVRGPDGDRFARRGVARVGAGEDSRLGAVADAPGDDVLALGRALVFPHRRALLLGGERLDERVLGGQHQVGRSEHGVGAGREHGDALAAGGLEDQLRPLAPADPVALQREGAGRPVEVVEVAEQALGVPGDREEPLLEEALLDLGVGVALAVAVDHLLVGDDAFVLRAPVDRRLLAERQPRLEELQKNPLRPLVVAGVGGGELVPPVEHAAEALELAAERVDIARDELRRVGAHRQREVLRVDAERVEPHRLEHVEALQPPEAAVDVRARECEHVPHVQPFGGRIREHHEVVERPARAIEVRLVDAPLLPASLHRGFDDLRIVVRGVRHKYLKLHALARS